MTKRVLQFNGRARRSEYWYTMLVVYLAGLILTPIAFFVLDFLTIPLTFRRLHDTGRSGWWWGAGAILKAAFPVVLGYEFIALVWDAMHSDFLGYDVAYAIYIVGKYIVWVLLILAYDVMMLVFMCMDSEPYENDYGESPKYVDDDEACE